VVGWPCHPVVVPAAVLPAPRLPRAHLAACRCLCRRLCRPRHPLCHPCTPPPIAPSQWPLPPPVSLRRPTISCLLRQLPLRQLPPTPGLALQFKFEFVSFAARRFHQQSHSATPECDASPPVPALAPRNNHIIVSFRAGRGSHLRNDSPVVAGRPPPCGGGGVPRARSRPAPPPLAPPPPPPPPPPLAGLSSRSCQPSVGRSGAAAEPPPGPRGSHAAPPVGLPPSPPTRCQPALLRATVRLNRLLKVQQGFQ
jgi:hypothetical protein